MNSPKTIAKVPDRLQENSYAENHGVPCLADENKPITIFIKKIAAATIITAALIALAICLKTVLAADFLQPYSPSDRTLVIVASEDAIDQAQKPLLSIVSDHLSTDQSRRKPSFFRTPIVSLWVVVVTIGLLWLFFLTPEGPNPYRRWIRTLVTFTVIMLPINYFVYTGIVANHDLANRQVDIETARGHQIAAVQGVTLLQAQKVRIRTATADMTTDYRTITFRDTLAKENRP